MVGCDRDGEEQPLRFTAEHEVARDVGDFDAVALTDGPLAVWSARGGLFIRPLDSRGRPSGRARRLGERCTGGIDVAGAEWIACLRRPGRDLEGGALLYRLGKDASPLSSTPLGPAGRDSRGIALVDDGSTVHVAWHDGTPGSWLIRRARVGRQDQSSTTSVISGRDAAAEMPSLAIDRGSVVAAWMESWIEDGRPRGHIVVRSEHKPAERVAEVHWAHTFPFLVSDPRGLVLGFRDVRDRYKRSSLYVVRLSATHRPEGPARRVGRADGPGPASLVRCEDRLFTVAPRTWNRHRLISIASLTESLATDGAERQVYQWGVAYARAAAQCHGDHLLMLIAERAHTPGAPVRLRSALVAPYFRPTPGRGGA